MNRNYLIAIHVVEAASVRSLSAANRIIPFIGHQQRNLHRFVSFMSFSDVNLVVDEEKYNFSLTFPVSKKKKRKISKNKNNIGVKNVNASINPSLSVRL